VQKSEVRFDIATLAFTDSTSLALSPDATMVAFESDVDGQSRIWVHSLASLAARPLMGTESASLPFWSPNNRSLGFFADGKLKRIDIDTGSVRVLADAPIGRGGTWSDDDTIIFAPGTNDPLFRVSAVGGESSAITKLEPTQAGHRFPQFLPDGKHFIYYVTGSPESRGVIVSDAEGSTPRRLFDADTAAVLATSGHLFFARQGTVQAQRFDPVARELLGTAFAVPEPVAIDGAIYRIALTASGTGSIAYRVASSSGTRQFGWFDRAGVANGTAGEAMDSVLSPAMSPDGQYVAFSRTVNGNQDIWLLHLESGIATRFTFDQALDFVPLWSADGSRIVYSSNVSGVFDLYEKPATGAGDAKLLLATSVNKFPVDWSPDGETLLYVTNDPETSYDLWTLPLGGDTAEPVPFVRTPFSERDGQFSPDGQWIAYQSNESGGRLEVYVQAFEGQGGRWQISTDGGAQVRWRDDGTELFYIALDGRLMATPVRVAPGPAIEAGTPIAQFTPRIGRGVQTSNRQQYMVAAGGEQFLLHALVEEATQAPIRMVLNWNEPQ
jgi:Tol biopolymer transport system component